MDSKQTVAVLGMGIWHDAQADNGFVSRIPTTDMSDKEIRDNMKMLKKLGFSPKLHESATMGQTIRLTGIDALNLSILRNTFIAEQNWQDGKTSNGAMSRICTKELETDQLIALNNSLAAENIVTVKAQSDKLGDTLRVEGKDFEKLKGLQKDYAPGKMKFIEKPKDDFGKKFMRAFNKVAAKVEKFVDGLKPKPAPEVHVYHEPDPKNFAGIWQKNEQGELVNILAPKVAAPVVLAIKPPGKP